MTHFGIICLEATGHLNTMFPLGHELQRRGHNITVFSTSNAYSGVSRAADIIEQAVSTRKPVIN